MLDWLSMGGYASYVWSAYGFAVGVLLVNIYVSTKRTNKVKSKIKQMENL